MRFISQIFIFLAGLLVFNNAAIAEGEFCLKLKAYDFPDSENKDSGFEEGGTFVTVNGVGIPFKNTGVNDAKGCLDKETINGKINTFEFGIYTRVPEHIRVTVELYRANRYLMRLFDIELRSANGDLPSYVGDTKIQLSAAALDPEVDLAIRSNISAIDVSINNISVENQLIAQLEQLLIGILSKNFDEISLEDLRSLKSDHLAKLIADLRKDKGELNNELEKELGALRDEVVEINDSAARELQDHSVNDENLQSVLRNLEFPEVELPQEETAQPFDQDNNQYLSLADETLNILQRALESNNRAYFLENVWSWSKSQLTLEASLSARADAQPEEYHAFMRAQEKVKVYIYKVLDTRFYFKDVPIPEDIKDGIEDEMTFFSPQLAASLKTTLNESPNRFSQSDSDLLIEMFRSIRAFYKLAKKLEDQKARDLLVEEANTRTQELIMAIRLGVAFSPLDPIVSFCEMVTGHEGCLAQGRALTEFEMAIAGAPFFLKGLAKVARIGLEFERPILNRVQGIWQKMFNSARKWDSLESLLHVAKGEYRVATDGTRQLVSGMHTKPGFDHFLKMNQSAGKTFSIQNVTEFTAERIDSGGTILSQTLDNGVRRIQLPRDVWANARAYDSAVAYTEGGQRLKGVKSLWPESYDIQKIGDITTRLVEAHPSVRSDLIEATFDGIKINVRVDEAGKVITSYPAWKQ